jgi:hypothetical protein
MTFEEALSSGHKYFRRKNFVQWIYRDENGRFCWRHWSKPFQVSEADQKAVDWEVWDGKAKAAVTHGPSETKSI